MTTPTQKSAEPVRSEIATPAAEVGIMPMDVTIRTKLSVMMFLQYFTWGTWYVTLGTYLATLNFSGERIGLTYGTSALGAMIAPFFVGMIADRFFATQHILAALHLAGAVVLYFASTVDQFSTFYPLMLLYFVCYMPTLALTNSLAFSHMSNPERQFPGIRVLGTIGWIAAGLLVGYLRLENANTAMQIGAVSSILLGLYCVTLPHTPPANPDGGVSVRAILGLDALALMKQWSFAIFAIGSFFICIPLQFYYGFTNQFLNDIHVDYAASKMTIGQMSEIFFMLIMPFFFARLGVKYMLLIGMIAWAARYVLFAFGDSGPGMWMLYIGIALHGVCYDFFFVTGYIYVDKKASETIRASAQGLITFITWGVGGFIGTWLGGRTSDFYTTDSVHDWFKFWMVPAIAAGVVTLIFALAFNDRVAVKEPDPASI